MPLSATQSVEEVVPKSAAASHVLGQARDAQGFLQQWLALAVARLPGVSAALLLSEGEGGAMVPAAMWPATIADVSPFAEAAQRCVDERRDVVLPLAEPAPDHAEPAPGVAPIKPQAPREGAGAWPRARASVVLASPVFSDERLVAALVFITERGAQAEVQRALADVQWGAGWIDALSRSRGRDAEQAALLRARQALDLVALIAQYERVDDACSAVAAEMARVGGGWRVAIGLVKGSRVRLAALSHAAWFDRRSQQAAAIERAMGEAVEQRVSLAWPSVHGDRMRVEQAQQDLALTLPGAQGEAGGVVTVPIIAGARAVGAVVWHVPAEQVTAPLLAQVAGMAVVLAPLLARLQDESRWFSGAVPAALRRGVRAATDPQRPAFGLGVAMLVALLAAVAFVPTDYRVPAKASLEGLVQRVMAAPFDGYVAEAPVRAGQRVSQGDLLARLEDRDLGIEQARLASELGQQEKKHAEAVAKRDRAEAAVLAAQMTETDAKLAQVEQRLLRTRVEAPFDGVVVGGDWSQAIGSPVEQGKTLFTLAPLTGYRVALKVDERDVRGVHAGQRGALLLSGMAGEHLSFTVRNVSVALAEDGKNLFRVEADLDGMPPRLRPGMEGVGKIDAGQRSLLWIWTHRLVEWVRLTWWRYMP